MRKSHGTFGIRLRISPGKATKGIGRSQNVDQMKIVGVRQDFENNEAVYLKVLFSIFDEKSYGVWSLNSQRWKELSWQRSIAGLFLLKWMMGFQWGKRNKDNG